MSAGTDDFPDWAFRFESVCFDGRIGMAIGARRGDTIICVIGDDQEEAWNVGRVKGDVMIFEENSTRSVHIAHTPDPETAQEICDEHDAWQIIEQGEIGVLMNPHRKWVGYIIGRRDIDCAGYKETHDTPVAAILAVHAWRRSTVQTALDLYWYRRFRPDRCSDRAW